MRAYLIALLLAAGCTDDTYVVVTVDRRPAVHDAQSLKVTLSNSGSMRTDDLPLAGHSFPLTFSISAPGRTGDLGLSIDALDGSGQLVGRGSGATTLATRTASVVLDSADFVVNTDFAGDQFLSDDFEAIGLQLAATSDGTWTASYRDMCTDCNVFGRRFDANGLAVQSAIAASANGFPITSSLTTSGSIPAVAASGTTTMVFWDYFNSTGTGQGVACRALDQTGNALPMQLTISTDSADVVTAAPLSNGNFAVTWQVFTTNEEVRTNIIKPDCTPAVSANPITVSTVLGSLGAHRSHVAANQDKVLYTWVVDGDVYVRPANNLAAFSAIDTKLIAKTASQQIDHVRIAPLGAGFAIVVRWSALSGTGAGKIELYRTTNTGTLMGGPTLITDKSGSDFASDKSFGVATRGDGALMIAWHECDTGPGSCEVFGRVVRPSGVPVGNPVVLATSTSGDQINPSVVALPSAFVAAWNDSSGLDPDHSGTAVRARVLYPPYDDASAILGAPCGGTAAACGAGLACAMGSDGMQRCYETCNAGAPPPTCPDGGTCSTVDAATSACTF